MHVSWQERLDGIDPAEFLARCRHHHVQALLARIVTETTNPVDWPEEVCRSLDDEARSAVAQDMLRAHALARVAPVLERENIPFLLMKGEALARTHYAQAGERVRADTDLFIPMNRVGEVRKAFGAAGFCEVSPAYKTHQLTVRYGQPGDHRVEMDLHWRILNAPRFARALSFEEALSSSRSIVVNRTNMRVLGDTDALLVACMHRRGSSFHDADRLIWLYDIHLLVSGMEPGALNAFLEKAVARGVQDVALDALAATRERLGTEVPAVVLDRLGVPLPRRSMAQRFSTSQLGLLLDDWRNLRERGARRRLLEELFVPSADELASKYRKNGKHWLPLLYLRHVLEGLAARLTLR